MGYSEFSKPGVKVQAEQIEEQRSVITPSGAVTGEPGDWELRYEDGNVRKLTDKEFQEEFGDASSGDDKTDTADDDKSEASDDDDAESDDIVSNGDSSDKNPAEDPAGDRTESDETTSRPAPPPPPRRRR